MKGLDYTALTLVIIGAINWGLIGLFRLDLVSLLFGNYDPGSPESSTHWSASPACIS